jgi:hypothetical protein
MFQEIRLYHKSIIVITAVVAFTVGICFNGLYSARPVGGGVLATWVVNQFTGTVYYCYHSGCRLVPTKKEF